MRGTVDISALDLEAAAAIPDPSTDPLEDARDPATFFAAAVAVADDRDWLMAFRRPGKEPLRHPE